MKIKGIVLNSSIETRDLNRKDGTVEREVSIAHILLIVKNPIKDSAGKVTGSSDEVVNIRAFRPSFDIPSVGKEWETPRVKKYENFDGNIAQVMV